MILFRNSVGGICFKLGHIINLEEAKETLEYVDCCRILRTIVYFVNSGNIAENTGSRNECTFHNSPNQPLLETK